MEKTLPSPEEKIKKLPKWAQAYIAKLNRERETAIRSLNKFLDKQTESPFYFDELLSTGEQQGPTFKRKYVQTCRMSVKYAGVILNILLRRDSIQIMWGGGEYELEQIALIPDSYQSARLVAKENMRTK